MDDSAETKPPGRFSPLGFLIGFGFGTFLGVGLALLAVALVRDNNTSSPASAGAGSTPVSAQAGGVTATPDLAVRTKAAMDVRVGPGQGYAVIGSLSRGEAVDVVGRDASSKWLEVSFPPGSVGRGWLPVSGLEGVSDVADLAIALPTPLPRTIDTSAYPSSASPSGNNTAMVATRSAATPGVPRATPTPTRPAGLPDLYIAGIGLLADGRVAVTIGNLGPGDLVDQAIFVIVRDLSSRSEQLVRPLGNLPAGATTTLTTQTFVVDSPTTVIATVDPYTSIPDANRNNNTVEAELSPPPTATPRPSGG